MGKSPPKDVSGGGPRRASQSYGRKRGRRLRAGRQRLMDELLPRLAVTLPPEGEPFGQRARFDASIRGIWLEIGFGAGEHLLRQAARNPEIGFIGAEVYEAGVASLLAGIARENLPNIRIFHGEATALLAALPAASIGRAFVLFPDPWRKTRHHKRRLIGPAGLAELARVLRDGAELRLATDHADYLVWMLEHILKSPDFEWTAKRPSDWRARPADWPETRYEAKAIREGRTPAYLRLVRKPRKSP
jgi:tRNA (guanine-N7-)-methyltransferase